MYSRCTLNTLHPNALLQLDDLCLVRSVLRTRRLVARLYSRFGSVSSAPCVDSTGDCMPPVDALRCGSVLSNFARLRLRQARNAFDWSTATLYSRLRLSRVFEPTSNQSPIDRFTLEQLRASTRRLVAACTRDLALDQARRVLIRLATAAISRRSRRSKVVLDTPPVSQA